MSVQNAGLIIKEARQKAGLSQEQLSEGVCTPLSLSRIENGSAGVSPGTFQALMAHAGVNCTAFPAFANRTDFDCFYSLKRVRFFLDSWQLAEAYAELERIEQWNWADNRFYYQEWLLLHGRLQFRSGCGDHAQIYESLLDALHISQPELDLMNFRHQFLSVNELELLICLAQEALYLARVSDCLHICTQISSYLTHIPLSFLDKDRLLAENGIAYAKYLLAVSDYEKALETSNYFRHQMAVNLDDGLLHELTFLTALGYYYTKETTQAYTYFKTAFFSAHAIGSCYATICKDYVLTHWDFVLPEGFSAFADIPLTSFPSKKAISSSLSDGTYDLSSPEALSIGGLIQSLRLEQSISQTVLCQGLCSKSKLSKIENGTLQPDVILAQTLLQRLGISDRVFTFYGDAKQSALQTLLFSLVQTPQRERQLIHHYINEMKHLCSQKDTLYMQWILFWEATTNETDAPIRPQKLYNALAVTLPDFTFNSVYGTCLSWAELGILNNLCSSHADADPARGTFYFYQLLEYYTNSSMDILEKKRLFPVTISMLIRHLYRQKRYSEILSLVSNFPALKDSIYFIGNVFAHYCQALAECGKSTEAVLYGCYSYYCMLGEESYANADALKNDLLHDFQITLL